MAINISDQFSVNVSLPMDSRIVAANSTARSNIQYKYDGLQVFDLSDRKTYVWSSSTSSWSPADVSGTGDVNRIPRWASTSGLTSSCIFFTSVSGNSVGKIGINTGTATIRGILQVNSGSSKELVISNAIYNNFISSNYYYSGSSDATFDVNAGSGAVKFRNNGEVWILGRQANSGTFTSPPIGVSDDNTSSNGALAIFTPDGDGFTGFIRLLKNTTFNNAGSGSGGAFIRSTSTLSTSSLPDYTWDAELSTGIYRPSSSNIGFSISGSQKMILNASGLLVSSSNNVTAPSSRLHIDGGNGVGTFIQITNGTTTGTGANTGLQIGINSSGYPVLSSRLTSNPYLFTFTSDNILYRFNRNQFDMYSNSTGEVFSTITSANGGGGSRVVRGTKLAVASGAATLTVDTLLVPSSSQVSIEATFVTSKAGAPNQFYTKKIIAQYTTGSTGTITSQNTGGTVTSGVSLAALTSTSTSGITNGGGFDTATANQIKMVVAFTGTGSGSSVVSYTAVISTARGTGTTNP